MLREFMKSIGRYKEGETHDYPKSTWDQISRNAGMKLESFTRPIANNPNLQNPLRGPVRIRKRLGAVS